MTNTVQIKKQFRGPPTSGNGGYSCGLIANHIGYCAKIRLHLPPPIETEMEVSQTDNGATLLCNDKLVGSGRPSDFELELPTLPDLRTAQEAETRFAGFKDHIFPDCFVCGPDRAEGDGLRIFPGPTQENDWSLLACSWQPSEDFFDSQGLLKHEFIWSALDCPSYFGVVGENLPKALLGEQELRILKDVSNREPLVVSCWPISKDGRKLKGGAALSTNEGEPIAYAVGTWILLNP